MMILITRALGGGVRVTAEWSRRGRGKKVDCGKGNMGEKDWLAFVIHQICR